MSHEEAINYEEIVHDYNHALNNVLRGFRPKYDFLELWVPDSNTQRSVQNLVESAQGQDYKSISLFSSKAICKDLDLKALSDSLKKYGKVELEPSKDGGTTLHLNRSAENIGTKEADSIDPLYREKMVELFSNLAHKGSILEDGDNLLIRSNKDGISLFGAVNTNNHTIHRARFSGSNKLAEAALLEGLCSIIEGLPIQEAFDHAIIKLEEKVRDHTQKTPVKGIVNVFNYPPMFALPLKLMRDLYQIYLTKSGFKPGDNYYHPAVSQKWKALPENEKVAAITQSANQLIAQKGFKNVSIRIMGIEQHHKISLGIEGSLSAQDKTKFYLDLESVLRNTVEPALEVFSQNLKDLNAIRRMN